MPRSALTEELVHYASLYKISAHSAHSEKISTSGSKLILSCWSRLILKPIFSNLSELVFFVRLQLNQNVLLGSEAVLVTVSPVTNTQQFPPQHCDWLHVTSNSLSALRILICKVTRNLLIKLM